MLNLVPVPGAVALSLALLFGSANAVSVGQAAPNFSLKDVSGKTVQLSDFKGKTVVLEWTNPGCPFVVKHYASPMLNMQGTQKSAIAMADVVWLSINSTSTGHADYLAPEKLAAWMAQKGGAPSAVLMDADGSVGKAYSAKTTPHMYVVDAKGQLVYAGAIDSIASARVDDITNAKNYVKAALMDVKAGKPVATSISQPYGCTVKYKS